MQRDGDLSLNVTCSQSKPKDLSRKLPARMPDGSKIENNPKLTKKINKTHQPAQTKSGFVFIPQHKLPVLDEFGLSEPSHHPRKHKEAADKKQSDDKEQTKPTESKAKRRKRKKREEEPKIIPREVQAVAGGLPPSYPKHKIKKFTEEYHIKKEKREAEGDDDDENPKKKRRSYVPGLNPRRRDKGAHVFSQDTLQDLEDLHPYLVSNLEKNYEIKKLTKIQSMTMPALLKTRHDSSNLHYIINSGVGTGKILSYVVPIVNNLALMEPKIDRASGIHAIVLLPTRELAAKVSDIFLKLCSSFLWVVPGLLTGGERKKSEKARLKKGLNILITTPGRLIDHMEHSLNLNFDKVKYCVLGDAHKLLDPERSEVAKKIAILLRKRLPSDCVRCIVTATMTKKLDKLIEILISKPTVIDAFKDFE